MNKNKNYIIIKAILFFIIVILFVNNSYNKVFAAYNKSLNYTNYNLINFVNSKNSNYFENVQQQINNISISCNINKVINLNPDFEYNYISEMIKNLLIDILDKKQINIDSKIKNIYIQSLFEHSNTLFKKYTDYNIPIKYKVDNSIYSSNEFNLLISSDPFIILTIYYSISFNGNDRILNLYILQKYKKSIESYNNKGLQKNLDKSSMSILEKIKKSQYYENNNKYKIYKILNYKLIYDPFTVYDDLNKLFQKKLLNDFLNIPYFELKVLSKKNYYLKVNGKILGSTNQSYYLKKGKKKIVIFLPGFESKQIDIDLNKNLNISIELNKVKNLGTIIVNTFPQNSEVWLDNKFIGYSPIKIENLKYGTHFLSIRKKGYTYREKLIQFEKKGKSRFYIYLFPENYLEFYEYYANTYLNLGYKKAFISGVYAGLSITSLILYNDMYLYYKYTNNEIYYYSYNFMAVSSIIFATLSFYELYNALIMLDKYTLIKENYNINN